jgi:hypothetical protein
MKFWKRTYKGKARSPAINWPWCNRCQDYVDSVSGFHDVHQDTMKITVYCHGEREVAVLNVFEFLWADEIRFGEAFKDVPRIEQGPGSKLLSDKSGS